MVKKNNLNIWKYELNVFNLPTIIFYRKDEAQIFVKHK